MAKLSAIQESEPLVTRDADIILENADIYGGRKASYEEFLELTKDNEERYEYIDGEIYWQASPRIAHQTASGHLFGVSYNWFQGKDCTS